MHEWRRTILEFDDFKRIFPVFQSPAGQILLKALMRIVGVERVNALYGRSAHLAGMAFLDSILAELQVSYQVENESVLDLFSDRPFITVSNHPYGALDGVLLVRVFAERFPNFKVMVNWILTYIERLAPYFIAVHPTSANSEINPVSFQGIREAVAHVRNGNPLGFFPAGAVSRYRFTFRPEDRVWQPNVVRLIRRAQVSVIPVYFHGQNSMWYNGLGLFSWRLRSLRLPRELFNKSGMTIRMTLGEPIWPERLFDFPTDEALARFLRSETYRIGGVKKINIY